MNRSARIGAVALFSAVVFLSAQTSFALVTLPANGLVAHLPGDGNDSDVTGNTNGGNGAYSGPYSAGFSGQAFDIAGMDDRDFAVEDPNGVLSPLGGPVGSGGTGAVTIGGWTKWQGGAGFLGLIYKHGATRTMALQSSREAGGLDFAIVGDGGTFNNRSNGESYNDGQWHSFIGVFADDVASAGNADTHILYIDGGANNGGETVQSPNNKDGNPSADLFNAGSDPFYQIGNYNPDDQPGGAWPGMIDEVFFYNRALTEQEVITVANQTGTEPQPNTDFTWNKDGLGDWNSPANWDPSFGASPGDPNNAFFSYHTAKFGDKITANRTVTTDRAVSLSAITFENVNTYAVAGTGSVNLVASTATGAAPTQIAVNLGNHQFQAIVALATDTTIDVANGSTLEFNNRLLLAGNTLTKTGAGMLAISNDVVSSGGSISLQQGSLVGSGTVGGDVDNNGGTVSPGNSNLEANSVVPEPAAWVTLGLGLLVAMSRLRKRRR